MTWGSSEEILRFLRRHRLAPEKALGQHFLIHPETISAIVADVPPDRSALEIGPGPGLLTRPLADGRSVAAIELDERMRAPLGEAAPQASVRFADALRCDLAEIARELSPPRHLVSNLPYYITAPLLERFAEARGLFEGMTLMMQREVADRVAAPAGNGERGSISVFLQRRFRIARVLEVPPDAFLPPPKVHSTVLSFTPREAPDDEALDALVRVGFAAPRKTLANNLRRRYDGAQVESALSALPPLVRPHQLTEEEWLELRGRLGD